VARDVFIAAGVGAFEARRLRGPGLDAQDGLRVFHPPLQTPPEAAWPGATAWVCGGDELALDWAFRLCDRGDLNAVTLLHRRDAFDAPPPALERLRHLRQSGALTVRVGQVVGADVQGDASDPRTPMALHLQTPAGDVEHHTAHVLLVCLGLSPRLGPLAEWGLPMARKQLVVDPATSATSVPHVYAVGDVNTYPGKRKLFTCGFHEATLAAYAVAQGAPGDGPVAPQLYTSSSTLLQRRLGALPPPSA
jgi:thioredoxin reductase (NADPH)